MRSTWLWFFILTLMGPVSAVEFAEARHLLSRTGFGGTGEEIRALSSLSYAQAVESRLAGFRQSPLTPAPDWVDERPPDPARYKIPGAKERKERAKMLRERAMELKAWWYREMLETSSPFTERMTLFWHNHFTSSARKVRWPPLLYRQNQLLRQHASGNFGDLLRDISRDPAMLLYLDNARSRKGNPNENFARELLELFTLGEGHYSEADVNAAARAFTGWTIDRRKGAFRFVPRWHDNGEKTFLGQSGNLDGDDIIRILLEQEQVAIHITGKLWRAFVSPEPDPGEVRRLANIFRDANYAMQPLLRAMLLSQPFRDARNRGTLVKSPVDFLVGSMRQLGLRYDDGEWLAMAGRRLGQDLFDPPNVKGWPGGNRWITSDTLLARRQLASRLTRGMEMAVRNRQPAGGMTMPSGKPGVVFQQSGGWSAVDGSVANSEMFRVLLPLPPVRASEHAGDRLTILAELLQDPVYQLK